MANKEDSIDLLKNKLRSYIKLKLNRERELSLTLLKERSLQEEMTTNRAECEFLNEQLEDIKRQIGQYKHQLSMINVCSTSEKCKINEQIKHLEMHRNGFMNMFERERTIQEEKLKAQEKAILEEQEKMKLREAERSKLKEQEASEIAALEAECHSVESECAVLKKRNHAIMLKLRRKLLETENIRREILKRKGPTENI